MEMLAHTNVSKVDDSHNTDVERKHGVSLFVSGDHGDAEAFGGNRVGLQPFGFCGALIRRRVLASRIGRQRGRMVEARRREIHSIGACKGWCQIIVRIGIGIEGGRAECTTSRAVIDGVGVVTSLGR